MYNSNIKKVIQIGKLVILITVMIITWQTGQTRPNVGAATYRPNKDNQEFVTLAPKEPSQEPPPPVKVKSWMDSQQDRKRILDRGCNRNPSLKLNLTQIIHEHKEKLSSYIVNDQFRLIFAYLLKVGSTNWKKAFFVLKGDYKQVEDVPDKRSYGPGLKTLSSYTSDDIEYRLQNYTKFVFVRDPYARILSAYRNKFLEPNKMYHHSHGRAIIARFRPKATNTDKKSGANVTFKEFVRAITSKEKKFGDPHWSSFDQMVLPCTVKFDFIGKLETAAEDSENILKYAKVDHLVHFKERTGDSSHDANLFKKFYSQLSADELHALQKKYKLDFELFGYDRKLKNYSGQFQKEMKKSIRTRS